jgi:methylated-DNA-protein-cysteine methyltransferase-like protein
MAVPEASTFSERVIELIKRIPHGRVATYGQIAACAGNPFAARQVAWLLHSSTRKHDLPWQRVINSQGRISLKPRHGYEVQRRMLRVEGVGFKRDGSIDLKRYLWKPRPR